MKFSNPHPDLPDLMGHLWAPDPSGPIANHLSSCLRCHERYDALERDRSAAAAVSRDAVDTLPETFWARQRLAVQRSIRSSHAPARPSVRFGWAVGLGSAAILALSVAVGSWIMLDREIATRQPASSGAVISATETIAMTGTSNEPANDDPLFDKTLDFDPWASDELEAFRTVVEWESWLESARDSETEGRS